MEFPMQDLPRDPRHLGFFDEHIIDWRHTFQVYGTTYLPDGSRVTIAANSIPEFYAKRDAVETAGPQQGVSCGE